MRKPFDRKSWAAAGWPAAWLWCLAKGTCLACLATAIASSCDAAPTEAGVPVAYRLPESGPLPQTYLVTLAIVDPRNPDWIISQCAAGVPRTVTAENGGAFTEMWDGLDDNFLPVPPGEYAVKGIFMPAQKWEVDGAFHAVVPRYVTSAEAWRALPGECRVPIVVGDPVDSPIGDVDVGANGVGVFCYSYLENARNFYAVDFKLPISYEQATPGYNSGGAAGGHVVATDGVTSWCWEHGGFVFRTDGKPFGKENGRYRSGVCLPEGFVTSMAAHRDEATDKTFLFMAQRGRAVRDPKAYSATEDRSHPVDQILVLDGKTAETLGSVAVAAPLAVVARWGDRLWVLHEPAADTFAVSVVPLKAGLPAGPLKTVLNVPAAIRPTDLEVDSHGRIYLADPHANHVHQFAPDGKPLRRFGRLDAQRPATYDPSSFMHPEKLSCWRDAAGRDHLIVVEKHGPQRVSEWNADDGTREREWLTAQTFANAGYTVDPRDAERIYIRGQGGWLTRFRVDYQSGAWQVEAVWPDVCIGRFENRHSGFPRMLYRGDTRYLAWPRGDFIYREAGDRWLPSAALFTTGTGATAKRHLWHDANGDGQVQDEEFLPHETPQPKGTQRYWGNSWLDDFSYAAIQEGTADVWRLPADSFDPHGNPIHRPDGWTKLLTDPVLQARRDNTATALFGGNEIADRFNSAWAMIQGNLRDGFYINSRGPDISANFGAQQKLSRYVPDGKGGFRLQWRTGRMAIHGAAAAGEVYGSIHVMPPLGGLVTQVDQSRMGMLLFTEEGLYVDTLFPDGSRVGHDKAGPYVLPGEFFTGYSYVHPATDKVYIAVGKTTPTIFEAEGWTGSSNPVKPLLTLPKAVTLSAALTAAAPDFALAVRRKQGDSAAARVARFAPLPGGGPALDGSLQGWEGCEPLSFAGGDKQRVEVRCGYDREHLYLRWHVRTGRTLELRPLEPAERIFTHDRLADTVSFFIQGNPYAPPAVKSEPRPGDVRLVFGLFEKNGGTTAVPAVLGMYPTWSGPEKPSPLTYRTPAGGAAIFAHVGLLPDVRLGHAIDADSEGFVLAAAIPRARVLRQPSAGELVRTQVNFDATLAGHNRFWWSNADGSATRETYDEPTEARLYPGSWSQAQFEPMDGMPVRAWSGIGPFGFAKLPQLPHLAGRPEICRTLAATTFPPESEEYAGTATYTGDLCQTRKASRTLRWKPASISGDSVSFDKALGWKGNEDEGTAYLATWIHSDAAAEIRLKPIDGHGHHAIRVWLNGIAVPGTLPPGQRPESLKQSLDPEHPVMLQAGWNKLLLRWDLIWGDNQVGIRLAAAPDILWGLRCSPEPPGADAPGERRDLRQ